MTKAIMTLDDLRSASPEEVKRCLSKITVNHDLQRYLKWLDDSETATQVVVDLKRNKKRSKGIHPSAACKEDVCLLRLYYDCTHVVKPGRTYVPESQLTWDIGTSIHCMLQTWLKAMYGDQFKDEVSLRNEDFHIYSHADGLFTFSDHRFVLEIKSIKEGGNYGFERVQLKPMADNVRQAHFYMWLADVPFALLFYFCKNNSKWKEHPVVFDFYLWEKIINTVVTPTVQWAYGNGDEVKSNPGWACRWCDYEHACPDAKSYKSRGDVNAAKNARQWSRSSW